jgi:hypothetical protein
MRAPLDQQSEGRLCVCPLVSRAACLYSSASFGRGLGRRDVRPYQLLLRSTAGDIRIHILKDGADAVHGMLRCIQAEWFNRHACVFQGVGHQAAIVDINSDYDPIDSPRTILVIISTLAL